MSVAVAAATATTVSAPSYSPPTSAPAAGDTAPTGRFSAAAAAIAAAAQSSSGAATQQRSADYVRYAAGLAIQTFGTIAVLAPATPDSPSGIPPTPDIAPVALIQPAELNFKIDVLI
jgi:hypothetical protein